MKYNNYSLINSTKLDVKKLINYKLQTVLEYAENLSKKEIKQIEDYVNNAIFKQLSFYKLILFEDKKIGCLLVLNKEDGILLDEIYIEKEYRNKGIGTNIISNILKNNETVYLWVYKANIKAISLYKKLQFQIIDETETRYYMKHDKNNC